MKISKEKGDVERSTGSFLSFVFSACMHTLSEGGHDGSVRPYTCTDIAEKRGTIVQTRREMKT